MRHAVIISCVLGLLLWSGAKDSDPKNADSFIGTSHVEGPSPSVRVGGASSAVISGTTANSRDCFDQTFCLESKELDGRVELIVDKRVPWEFTLFVDLKLENMRPDRSLPVVQSFGSRGREQILSLVVDQPSHTWTFEYNLKWVIGALEADHDDSYVYALPYSRDESYVVGQSYNGAATHKGKEAIDFDMPVGTRVRAARDGIVVAVEENFYKGGLDPSLKTGANYVRIRHADGTIGNYVHLMQNGVKVYQGDAVRRGDVIAYSGHTGYSSGPHLHFEVYTISRSLNQLTIPVRFRANGKNNIIPAQGNLYGH